MRLRYQSVIIRLHTGRGDETLEPIIKLLGLDMKNGVHLALLPEKPKFFVETATLNLRVQGPLLRLVCPFYLLFLYFLAFACL